MGNYHLKQPDRKNEMFTTGENQGLTSICKGKIRKRKNFMTPCVLCAPSASTNIHVQPRRADPHAKRKRKHQKSCERQNRTWRRRACKGSSFSSRAGGGTILQFIPTKS